MIAYPCAKLNLGLHVVRKRPDGFHDLESVFVPLGWTDILEVMAVSGPPQVIFSTDGLPIPGAAMDNLAVRAYHLLAADRELPAVRMHLHKRVPMGAGLGGGSSDGAFALRLLNRVLDLQLSQDQLSRYAAQLGSDCPFFIQPEPAYVTGRGDQREALALDLSGWYVLVIHPGLHVGTAEAYQGITPQAGKVDLRQLGQWPVVSWRGHVENHFERSVFPNYPAIAALKAELYDAGAAYASMSGSGSAVYGLFRELPAPLPGQAYLQWSGPLVPPTSEL